MQSLRLLRTARLEKSDQAGNARPAFLCAFLTPRAAPVWVVCELTDQKARLFLLANVTARQNGALA